MQNKKITLKTIIPLFWYSISRNRIQKIAKIVIKPKSTSWSSVTKFQSHCACRHKLRCDIEKSNNVMIPTAEVRNTTTACGEQPIPLDNKKQTMLINSITANSTQYMLNNEYQYMSYVMKKWVRTKIIFQSIQLTKNLVHEYWQR